MYGDSLILGWSRVYLCDINRLISRLLPVHFLLIPMSLFAYIFYQNFCFSCLRSKVKCETEKATCQLVVDVASLRQSIEQEFGGIALPGISLPISIAINGSLSLSADISECFIFKDIYFLGIFHIKSKLCLNYKELPSMRVCLHRALFFPSLSLYINL